MTKNYDFASVFEEAEERSSYWVERAILDFTEETTALMEREGVSRSELARRMECSGAYVTKILRGSTNFTLESMVRVGRALGCELRTHLQPCGARSQWFDVLEKPSTASAFRTSSEMHIALDQYVLRGKESIGEKPDDSVALAS